MEVLVGVITIVVILTTAVLVLRGGSDDEADGHERPIGAKHARSKWARLAAKFPFLEVMFAVGRDDSDEGQLDGGLRPADRLSPSLPAAEPIEDADDRISHLSNEAASDLRALHADLQTLMRNVDHHPSVPLMDVLATQVGTLGDRFQGLPSATFPVETPVLYERIIHAIEGDGPVRAQTIQIVDQDILRWHELLDANDRIVFNTINYSRDILNICIQRAQGDPAFRLERVLVFDTDALARANVQKEEVQAILAEIQRICSSSTRIQNFALDLRTTGPERSNLSSARTAADYAKDVVVAALPSHSLLMFKEDISYRNREKAYKTSSSMCADPGTIKLTQSRFEVLRDAAVPLADYIHALEADRGE